MAHVESENIAFIGIPGYDDTGKILLDGERASATSGPILPDGIRQPEPGEFVIVDGNKAKVTSVELSFSIGTTIFSSTLAAF